MSGTNPELGSKLFDRLPKGVDSFSARQMFDGTVFNGINGVRVNFDDEGNVSTIGSTNILTGERSPSFRFGENGGFKGEGGFYGESTEMGRRLTAIVTEAKTDWQMWKEMEGEHPGIDFRTWKADRVKAMASEAERILASNNAFSDEDRKSAAIAMGMPEDTPLHVLNDLREDMNRKRRAVELGQPEDTPLWKLNDLEAQKKSES